MAATRWAVLLLVAGLFLPALSGCLDASKKSDPTPSAPRSATTTRARAAPNATEPAEAPEAPVADFFVLPNPAIANQTVTFNATNAYDPEGGNLTFGWRFNDGGTASGVLATHVFAQPGTYRVTLSAASDASGLTGEAGLNLTVLDPASIRQPLRIPDAEGDATPNLPYGDLVGGSLFLESSGTLRVVILLKSLQPSYETLSAVMGAFALNGSRYEVTGLNGRGGLWDVAGNRQINDAAVALDGDAGSITVRVPLASLGKALPLKVYLETRVGEPNAAHGQLAVDRAPNGNEELTYAG